MLEEGGDRAEALGEVGQELHVVRKTTTERTELFEVGRHGHYSEGGNLGDVWANYSRGDGVTEKIGVNGIDFCL